MKKLLPFLFAFLLAFFFSCQSMEKVNRMPKPRGARTKTHKLNIGGSGSNTKSFSKSKGVLKKHNVRKRRLKNDMRHGSRKNKNSTNKFNSRNKKVKKKLIRRLDVRREKYKNRYNPKFRRKPNSKQHTFSKRNMRIRHRISNRVENRVRYVRQKRNQLDLFPPNIRQNR